MGNRRGLTRESTWRSAALICAITVSLSAPLRAQDDVTEARPFALPDTRAARGLVTAVEGHLAADRPIEAIARLQELLEDHAGALLPGRRTDVGGYTSQQLVHQGIGPWATAHLFSLAAGAQESYKARYEELAGAQLERALRSADRESLAAVGTRWPLTSAAEQAWWALGDLSLERGELSEARSAWERAIAWSLKLPTIDLETAADWRAAATQLESRADIKEIATRLEFAAASLESSPSFDAHSKRPSHGELRLPGQGELFRGPAAGDGSSWSKPYVLNDHPFKTQANNFFAARSKDRVVVSDSMRAVCLQAFSGEVLWDSGRARGWDELSQRKIDEFHKTLDYRYAMIAPALTDKVAVCALEVPFSAIENQDYNNIQILRIIPDRRLFAFDLESGEELWSHQPEPGWDGESGNFTETSRIAGPAVITGGRILVPAYRLEGRISFHLACYELATGELIWNTQLISGQRELNMFNRHQREFSAPPVRVEGDRVIALTQLGVVACLDLFNGQLLWETVYDQVAIPGRASNFRANQQEHTWSNSPPVVGDDVVVCTPLDSHDMIGLDIDSGAMLWSLGRRDLESLAGGYKSKLRHLIGCDKTTVFLAGERIIAVEAPFGLSHDAPTRARWVADKERSSGGSYPPRAVLLEDRVVIPTADHRSDIDRNQGFLLSNPSRWSKTSGPGNVLICDDAVFTLNNRQLNGHFEWDSLVERSRVSLAAEPESQALANALAKLLCERGKAEIARDREETALAIFDEARALLQVERDISPTPRDKTAAIYNVLTERARAFELLGDQESATNDWREAAELELPQPEKLAAYMEQQRLLQMRDPLAWLELLEELERDYVGAKIRCIQHETGLSGLIAAPFTGEDIEEKTWDLSVKLWAEFARIEHHRGLNDAVRETAGLYRLMTLESETALPTSSPRKLALRRLDQLLIGPEADALLEPYEAQASALLQQLNKLDLNAVSAVLHKYPRTKAAAQASSQLLARAAELGDVATAAKLVRDSLPGSFSLGAGDPLSTASVLSLGLAMKVQGNDSYLRSCLSHLKSSGSVDSAALQALFPRDLAELEAELLSTEAPVVSDVPDFSSQVRAKWSSAEDLVCKILGELPPSHDGPSDPERMLLVGSRAYGLRNAQLTGELMAFGSSDLSEPRWRQKIGPESITNSWGEEFHLFGPGYAVISSHRGMRSINRSDGSTRWTWSPEDGELNSIDSTAGLVIAKTLSADQKTARLQALDDESGQEIWSYEYSRHAFHSTVTVGEAWITLLPSSQLRHTLVLDAFTGRIARSFNLKRVIGNSTVNSTWIQDGKLIIPHLTGIRPSTNGAAIVDLVDLTNDSEPWTVSLPLRDGGRARLELVLRHAERTWFVVRPRGGGPDREGSIFELHSGVGAAAQLHGISLKHNEVIPKNEDVDTLELDSPHLFVRREARGGYQLRSHDLNTGTHLWTWELGSNRDMYTGSWPTPTVSANAVAVVVTEIGSGGKMRTNILFIDPHNGSRMGGMTLNTLLGWSDTITLKALGDGILVTGGQMMEVLR